MKSTTRWTLTLGLALAMAVGTVAAASAAEMPAPPKVSTFAPAKDVVAQVEFYLDRLDKAVATEEEYKASEGQIVKDANTMVLLALAAGLHDEENKYQAAAPALMKASQELAKVKDFAAAKAGVDAVKKAAESKGDPSQLKWAPVADLPELMKQVPLINTKLRLYVSKPTYFKKRQGEAAGMAASLAVIAQGTLPDTSEATTPEQEKQWFEFMAKMRDNAAAIHQKIQAGDQPGAAAGLEPLTKSCDECHAVFAKDQVGKQ